MGSISINPWRTTPGVDSCLKKDQSSNCTITKQSHSDVGAMGMYPRTMGHAMKRSQSLTRQTHETPRALLQRGGTDASHTRMFGPL